MATKYTEWPQNIPSDRKIDQIAIKYINSFHRNTLQNLPKLVLLVCTYIYHLATLVAKQTFHATLDLSSRQESPQLAPSSWLPNRVTG
jgi:hypothetical protein